jgi:hypothetical protein
MSRRSFSSNAVPSRFATECRAWSGRSGPRWPTPPGTRWRRTGGDSRSASRQFPPHESMNGSHREVVQRKVSPSRIQGQRPYHVENTGSRPITEVKQRWARFPGVKATVHVGRSHPQFPWREFTVSRWEVASTVSPARIHQFTAGGRTSSLAGIHQFTSGGRIHSFPGVNPPCHVGRSHPQFPRREF